MIIDNIAASLIGGATAGLVLRALNRKQANRVASNSTLTTPTNPVVLAVAKSAVPEHRLRLLVESGAITCNEYLKLTGSPLSKDEHTSRLSILHNGPNKSRTSR